MENNPMRKITQIAFSPKGLLYCLWDDGTIGFRDGTMRDGIWREISMENVQGAKVSQKEIK